MDVLRAGEAISRPGIDPRTWVAYGTVDDDPDAVAIEAGGVFVDVTLHPSEKPVTCRWGGIYAAPGGAVFFPVRRRDEVMVLVPDGDEDAGCVAMPRLHNDIDTFPLTVNGREVDGSFPFVKIEEGDWELEVSGTIRMQGSNAVEAARKGDTVRVTVPIGTFLVAANAGVLNAAPVDIDGTITSGSSKVKIGS
jgi:hypothetical protein